MAPTSRRVGDEMTFPEVVAAVGLASRRVNYLVHTGRFPRAAAFRGKSRSWDPARVRAWIDGTWVPGSDPETVRVTTGTTPFTGAQADLFHAYIDLAHAVARRFLARSGSGRDEFRDEIRSAALLGLLNATHWFDPTLGCSFATYARGRIWCEMVDRTREIAPGGFTYLPASARGIGAPRHDRDPAHLAGLADRRRDPRDDVDDRDEAALLLSLLDPDQAALVRSRICGGRSQRRVAADRDVGVATVFRAVCGGLDRMRRFAAARGTS